MPYNREAYDKSFHEIADRVRDFVKATDSYSGVDADMLLAAKRSLKCSAQNDEDANVAKTKALISIGLW